MHALVFDWEEDLSDLLSYNLSQAGFKVLTSEDEETLLAIAGEVQPRIVIISSFPDYQHQSEVIHQLGLISPNSLLVNLATHFHNTKEGQVCGPNLVCIGIPVEMRTLISIIKSHLNSAGLLDQTS